MEKRISYTQFQSVKSVAKACDPIQRQKEAVKRKIEKLVEEYKGYEAQIEALQAGIVQVIGFPVDMLVQKVISTTGATDTKGNPVKVTKYLPTNVVTYDEQHKQYVINIPSAEEISAQVDAVHPQETIVPPTTADGPGSDYDIDAEASGMPF